MADQKTETYIDYGEVIDPRAGTKPDIQVDVTGAPFDLDKLFPTRDVTDIISQAALKACETIPKDVITIHVKAGDKDLGNVHRLCPKGRAIS